MLHMKYDKWQEVRQLKSNDMNASSWNTNIGVYKWSFINLTISKSNSKSCVLKLSWQNIQQKSDHPIYLIIVIFWQAAICYVSMRVGRSSF